MVIYLGQQGLSKSRTSWVGQPGSLPSCVAGTVFEVDALAIKSLMSGT